MKFKPVADMSIDGASTGLALQSPERKVKRDSVTLKSKVFQSAGTAKTKQASTGVASAQFDGMPSSKP